MRNEFAKALLEEAKKNSNIILLTGDLGFGLWDEFRKELPNQFINCGASEQAMMGIGVGLALEEKIPIVYSITTFLLYRPFETIRNYINYEKINVKLVGSGVKRAYIHDGWSHWADDVPEILSCFKNIKQYWPEENEDAVFFLNEMLQSNKPSFIGLKR